MTYGKDPRVDAHIDPLPDWEQRICQEVRDIVHEADTEGIITGGHGNETGQMTAIHENDPINRPAMLALFRAITANNRAGGWQKLKKQ